MGRKYQIARYEKYAGNEKLGKKRRIKEHRETGGRREQRELKTRKEKEGKE